MANDIFQFLITVPVSNSALRAFITVGVILMLGFTLYLFWEILPELSHFIKRVTGEMGESRTKEERKTHAPESKVEI
jgi:hypothetical protein